MTGRRPALDVSCPECHVAAGEFCRPEVGNRWPHQARAELASVALPVSDDLAEAILDLAVALCAPSRPARPTG